MDAEAIVPHAHWTDLSSIRRFRTKCLAASSGGAGVDRGGEAVAWAGWANWSCELPDGRRLLPYAEGLFLRGARAVLLRIDCAASSIRSQIGVPLSFRFRTRLP